MSTIKLRRDTAANWLAADPVLSIAEPGLETDTSYVKYGDGATPWTSLPYASSVASALVNGGPSVTVDDYGSLTVPGNVTAAGFATTGTIVIPNDGSAGGIQSQNNLGQIYFNDDNSLLFIITGTYQVSFNADGTVQFPGYVFPEGTGSTGQVLVAGSNPLYLEWQDQTSTSSSLGDFTFSNSIMHIPVIGGGSTSYLNAGGVGTRNSVQIRTEINYVDTDINTSEIAIEAGNGGFSAQVYGHWTGGADGSGGPTLVYAGVENLSGSNGPGFAGFLANDPSVTSEYTVKIDGGGNICVSPFNPYTSDTYSAALGALASFDGGSGVGQFNGIFADPAKTYLKGSNGVNVTTVGGQWTFGADGSLTLPDGSGVAGGFIYGAPGTGAGVSNGGTGYQQFFVQGDGAYVQTSVGNTGTVFNSWKFGLDGSTSLPLGGTVKETQFVSGGGIGGDDLQGTLVLTPNGAYNPWNNLTIYNTGFNAETQHLHLTSGDLNQTEIVLGDDNKFVKVNLDGSVCVQSSRYYLYNLAGTSGASDTVISYANLNSIVSVGDYIIDAHGNAYQVTGITGTDPNWTIATNWASLTPLLASPYSFYKPTSTGGLWQFGADGSLTAPGAIYGGSNSIGLVTPAPLNLNNTGPIGQSKTQLNLINTAGNGGTGSAIDYYTYVDQGNGLPGARLSAVDDDNYSANFSIALKGRGNAGNNGLTTVWQFGSDGSLTLPAGGTVSYTPATASDWTGTPPTTIQEALDRLAAAFKTANGTGA